MFLGIWQGCGVAVLLVTTPRVFQLASGSTSCAESTTSEDERGWEEYSALLARAGRPPVESADESLFETTRVDSQLTVPGSPLELRRPYTCQSTVLDADTMADLQLAEAMMAEALAADDLGILKEALGRAKATGLNRTLSKVYRKLENRIEQIEDAEDAAVGGEVPAAAGRKKPNFGTSPLANLPTAARAGGGAGFLKGGGGTGLAATPTYAGAGVTEYPTVEPPWVKSLTAGFETRVTSAFKQEMKALTKRQDVVEKRQEVQEKRMDAQEQSLKKVSADQGQLRKEVDELKARGSIGGAKANFESSFLEVRGPCIWEKVDTEGFTRASAAWFESALKGLLPPEQADKVGEVILGGIPQLLPSVPHPSGPSA